MADHLSRLEPNEQIEEEVVPINEGFVDEQLITVQVDPWFADIANYLARRVVPPGMNWQQKKRFFTRVKNYYWDDPYLFKECNDNIIRRCVLESEIEGILRHCHTLQAGGHHGAIRTAAKVLQCGFYWPTLFADAISSLQCGFYWPTLFADVTTVKDQGIYQKETKCR